MYTNLITAINATLKNLKIAKTIKQFSNVPGTEVTGYPYVFYKPDGFENSFETNAENAKVYNFMLLVIIGIEGTTASNVFGTVLPNVVDKVVAQFDTDWDQGTLEGHRLRVLVDSAAPWELVGEEKDGRVAYASMNVQFKVLSNN